MSNISRPKLAAERNGLAASVVELARSKREMDYTIEPGKNIHSANDFGRRHRGPPFLRGRRVRGLRNAGDFRHSRMHHDSVLSEEEQATNEKVMICCCRLRHRAAGAGYVTATVGFRRGSPNPPRRSRPRRSMPR